MFRKELPRLYELRDQIIESQSPHAYFKDFDNKLKDPHIKGKYRDLEKELQRLDPEAWKLLKKEAIPYLLKDSGTSRGWEQLFNILQSHAWAYNYLKRIGCSGVYFIPSSRKKGLESPDLKGITDSDTILCEVKTINISDDEVKARSSMTVRTMKDQLEKGFFDKLESVITKATKQLESYDPGDKAKRIVYMIVHFDDPLGEYKEEYYSQIDQYFAENPVYGIEIVFHNQKTPFHKPICMNHVSIFNEGFE